MTIPRQLKRWHTPRLKFLRSLSPYARWLRWHESGVQNGLYRLAFSLTGHAAAWHDTRPKHTTPKKKRMEHGRWGEHV